MNINGNSNMAEGSIFSVYHKRLCMTSLDAKDQLQAYREAGNYHIIAPTRVYLHDFPVT